MREIEVSDLIQTLLHVPMASGCRHMLRRRGAADGSKKELHFGTCSRVYVYINGVTVKYTANYQMAWGSPESFATQEKSAQPAHWYVVQFCGEDIAVIGKNGEALDAHAVAELVHKYVAEQIRQIEYTDLFGFD